MKTWGGVCVCVNLCVRARVGMLRKVSFILYVLNCLAKPKL